MRLGGTMKTLLDNPGLQALTAIDEKAEIKLITFGQSHSLESRIKAAVLRKRKIIFAFFQDDFQGGRIPYWHVTNPGSKNYQSTLSMEGLKEWKVL